MSYENAPGTEMLATHCAVCGRPLLDAVSVEASVGPECRRKHGYGEAQAAADWTTFRSMGLEGLDGDDAHALANRIVHRIALEQRGERVPSYVLALEVLGYQKLARKIADRVTDLITVEAEGDALLVKAPYSESFNFAARKVPGARWDRDRKVRVVPSSSRAQLWGAIKAAFGPGTMIAGTKLAML